MPYFLAADVSKTYPGTKALDAVTLSAERGEVRAILGENGSGKSTLIGILSGRFEADQGAQIEVAGEQLVQGSPAASRRLGIAVIHQELTIVPRMSALENVFLGQTPRRGVSPDSRRMRDEYRSLCARLGVDIPARRLAGDLSVAQQAMLEIMRAVRMDARVLLLDEPTATLGANERESLYAVVASLKDAGVTCIWISHDIDEIFTVADSVTVLRNGVHVRTAAVDQWTPHELVRAMLEGTSAATHESTEVMERVRQALGEGTPVHSSDRPRATDGPLVMSIADVTLANGGFIDRLDIRAGEVLGIAGLVGSGRTSLLRSLVGLSTTRSGTMTIAGTSVRWPRNPSEALANGVALLPEDRKRQGLILSMSVVDNVALTKFTAVARLGILNRAAMSDRVSRLLAPLNFRGDIAGKAAALSGGNQQKVLVAKWLNVAPRLLLIDEPTRGIDVGAKLEILAAIRRLADEGNAVVMVSSELEEVASLADRVMVMRGGSVIAELAGPVTKSEIMHRFGE